MQNETKFVDSTKPFSLKDHFMDKRVVDFWRWAYSELNDNTLRGVLAEYIVAVAIGVDDVPRQHWGSYDLTTGTGKKVEVKNTARVQAWDSKNIPIPKFVIPPKRVWITPETITENPTFNADIYVLCYFYETNRSKANPTNLDKWKFWVFSQKELVKLLDGKKSITVDKLEKTVKSLNFDGLKAEIETK